MLKKICAVARDVPCRVHGAGDLTVTKRIPITETVSMRLQSEFYNAFNHTVFNNPNTTVTNGSFGTISRPCRRA